MAAGSEGWTETMSTAAPMARSPAASAAPIHRYVSSKGSAPGKTPAPPPPPHGGSRSGAAPAPGGAPDGPEPHARGGLQIDPAIIERLGVAEGDRGGRPAEEADRGRPGPAEPAQQ